MSVEPCNSVSSRIGALTLLRVLGTGASATVYHSRSDSGVQYAVKVVRVGKSEERCRKRVRKEILLHSLVSPHPNIVPLLDVLSNDTLMENAFWPRYTLLVLPYASSGDLYSLILKHKLYLNKPTLLRSVFLQVLRAVEHCHTMGVFHRDIKSENILTFDNGRNVMLADFGLATTETKSQEWVVGTLSHMSPECIGGSYGPKLGYSPAANDVWSLGILLVNLLTACHPWHKATPADESFVKYCRGPSEFLTRVLPLSPQANAILRRVFVAEDQRPNVTTFIANVGATKEWYSPNVVFEGCLARWRQSEDCVGPDGWVQCESVCREGLDTQSFHLNHNSRPDLEHIASEVPSMDSDSLQWRGSVFISEKIVPLSPNIFNSFPLHDVAHRDNHTFVPISGTKTPCHTLVSSSASGRQTQFDSISHDIPVSPRRTGSVMVFDDSSCDESRECRVLPLKPCNAISCQP